MMNKELFVQYLHNPALLDENSISNLAEIVTEYPYFQTAHLLYVKSLHDNKSIRYPSQLKNVAAYVGDRAMLFKLIKQQATNVPHESVTSQTTITETRVLAKESEIATVVRTDEEATHQNQEEYIELIENNEINAQSTDSGDLMDFDFNIEDDTITNQTAQKQRKQIQPQFLDYVYNLEQKPPITSTEQVTKTKRSAQLIDAFIEKNPRIIPKSNMDDVPLNQEDISSEYVEEPELMTEILADIYIKQKNYAKAANIYQKLMLLYPQKSIYFAQKIEHLKELSIQ